MAPLVEELMGTIPDPARSGDEFLLLAAGVSFKEDTGCSCRDGRPDPLSPPPGSPVLATELEAVRGGADSAGGKTTTKSNNPTTTTTLAQQNIPRTFDGHFVVVDVVLSGQSDLGVLD
jgi:hypothetical protein